MTEKQEALVRTLKPIAGGMIAGLLIYFAVTHMSLAVISTVIIVAMTIYFTYLIYDHNLTNVRRERRDKEFTEYSK